MSQVAFDPRGHADECKAILDQRAAGLINELLSVGCKACCWPRPDPSPNLKAIFEKHAAGKESLALSSPEFKAALEEAVYINE